ncbi:uncharacterized protein [Chiloscyllium punctatum]
MLQKKVDSLQKQLAEISKSQEEEEANINTVKQQAGSLQNNIVAKFDQLHQFLHQQEQSLRTKLQQKEAATLQKLEKNLDKISEQRLAVERTVGEIQKRLTLQEADFLKDVIAVLDSPAMQFEKPTKVPADLGFGEFSGPLQYMAWKQIVKLINPANLMTAVIHSRGKCGLSKGITRYMVTMAISDIIILIIHVLQEIIVYYYPYYFLSRTAICPSHSYLKVLTIDYAVWLIVSFTFDRFISICCQSLRLTYCTERTALAVIVSIFVLSCLKYIPFHFMYESMFVLDKVEWGCQTKSVFFTSLGWASFSWMCSVSISILPFFFILLLNGLTVKHIMVTCRVRRGLKRHGKCLNQNDSEMENRKKSIVLLFTVSGTYILLWMTETVTFMYTRVTVNGFDKNYSSPVYIANEVGVFLMHLNFCTNTCIYSLTQIKFREEVKKGVHYLFTPARKFKNLSHACKSHKYQ